MNIEKLKELANKELAMYDLTEILDDTVLDFFYKNLFKDNYTLREIHLGMLITAQSLIFKDDLTKEKLENIRLETELLANKLKKVILENDLLQSN